MNAIKKNNFIIFLILLCQAAILHFFIIEVKLVVNMHDDFIIQNKSKFYVLLKCKISGTGEGKIIISIKDMIFHHKKIPCTEYINSTDSFVKLESKKKNIYIN